MSTYYKVVSAEEMARVEKGHDQKAFMEAAGKKVAAIAQQMGGKKVALLIGKGNNGGDACVAGRILQQLGYEVTALVVEGGNGQFVKADLTQVDLIIDGLLGTGFHGQVEGQFKQFIEAANKSGKKILAIDIPSGVNGTTGEVRGAAIQATATVTLGLPKSGLFLRDGWKYTGKLYIEDFGLPKSAIDEAKAEFLLPKFDEWTLPPMSRTQHKYERGFVLGFGGSTALKGAVKLSGRAALHAGAGIVKLFSLEEIGSVDDELIAQIFEAKKWEEALQKAQAVFVGPGLGRGPAVKQWLQTHLPKIKQPCVIDADALFFLPEMKQFLPKSILTPHRGEMAHLLGTAVTEKLCAQYANEHNLTLILKGAPTFVFSEGKMVVIPLGDPGMATAGSGDVLTGILAALLAQGKPPLEAAVLGAALHALSGEAAAIDKTSYGYTAGDLIAYLPKALANFLRAD